MAAPINFPIPANMAGYITDDAIECCQNRTTPVSEHEMKVIIDGCVEKAGGDVMRTPVKAVLGAYAIMCRNVVVTESIIEHMWNEHKIIQRLVGYNSVEGIRFAFETWPNVFSDTINNSRGRVLRDAIFGCNIDIINLLLENGASAESFSYKDEESVLGNAVCVALSDSATNDHSGDNPGIKILSMILDHYEGQVGSNDCYAELHRVIKNDADDVLRIFIEKDKLEDPDILYNMAVEQGAKKCMALLE